MRYEMVQCDECCEKNELANEAEGWIEKDGEDLCPRCADAKALEAEHHTPPREFAKTP
jgi:hypothetical protein